VTRQKVLELWKDFRQSTRVSGSAPGPTHSDDSLVVRARAGDRDAFAAIYHRYHVGIYQFARAMTGSPTLAEDVTQEVFVELMRTLDRYDSRRGALSTYLYAITRNVCRHKLRRERRFVGFDLGTAGEPKSADDPSYPVLRSQTVARVRAFIKALPEPYREVLVLCDLQGMSYEAAAAVVDAPVGTVRSRLHRARQQLAERITQADEQPASIRGRASKCLI
jgi:RNA polymerase sigma-70 factor (ECF subfamily)